MTKPTKDEVDKKFAELCKQPHKSFVDAFVDLCEWYHEECQEEASQQAYDAGVITGYKDAAEERGIKLTPKQVAAITWPKDDINSYLFAWLKIIDEDDGDYLDYVGWAIRYALKDLMPEEGEK